MRTRKEIVVKTAEFRERLFAYVKRIRKVYAPGQLEELDRRMGRTEGHTARMLRGETGMSVDDVLKLPAALEIDPEEYFRGAFGFSVEIYLWELSRKTPGQIQAVRRKVAKASESSRVVDDLRRRVDALEDLRFSDPDAAEAECFRILGAANSDLESDSEAWGVLAALCRVRGRFSAAALAVLHELQSAKVEGSKSLEARALQRACYLIGDQNDYEHAAKVAQRAFSLLAESGDFASAGKALVDIGIMQDRAGRTDLAIAAYEASLKLLPEVQWRSRLAACQGLGLAYLDRDRVRDATGCCETAADLAVKHGAELPLRAGISRLQAEIAIRQRDWTTAKSELRAVQARWIERRNTFDLITVSLRLAWVLLICGEVAELKALANRMSSLVGSLTKHEFLEAALTRFVRDAGRGDITLDVIDSTYLAFFAKLR